MKAQGVSGEAQSPHFSNWPTDPASLTTKKSSNECVLGLKEHSYYPNNGSNIKSAEGNSHLSQPPVQDLSFFLLFSGLSKASLEVLLPLCLISLQHLSEASLLSDGCLWKSPVSVPVFL